MSPVYDDFKGCPVRPIDSSASWEEVMQLAASMQELDPSCVVLLDEYAREIGLDSRAPQGIQVEANKVAGGNFFWAAPEADIDLTAIRAAAETQADLFSSGALGMGMEGDFFKAFLEDATKARAQDEEHIELVSPLQAASRMISLRDMGDAWELYAVDLKAFARACGFASDALVVLPSFWLGKPIVKASPSALGRPRVQGVKVAYLVLPSELGEVPAGLLSYVAAETVYIPHAVSRFGPQQNDLSLFSPRLETRTYVVDEAHDHFASHQGSLVSRDGRVLYHLAPPYDAKLCLDARVAVIADQSLSTGVVPPAIVAFPAGLEEVKCKAFDQAVWVGQASDRLKTQFAMRSIRFTGSVTLGDDRCVFEEYVDAASLIAGPPQEATASQAFARSRAQQAFGQERTRSFVYEEGEVRDVLSVKVSPHGLAVTSIASHALLTSPKYLEVADSVRSVGDGNGAKGCKRLILHEGLEQIGQDCFVSRSLEPPVAIPSSVNSIGVGSFQYAVCLFKHDGSIVHVPADALRSPFTGEATSGAPFDVDRYDQALVDGRNVPDKLGAYVHRLVMPVPLEDDVRRHILQALETQEADALARVAREGNTRIIDALFEMGYLGKNRMTALLEALRAANRMDCLMHAMALGKDDTPSNSVASKFSL